MQNLSYVMVDASGNGQQQLLHMTDAAILTDGLAAVSTASNADWLNYWGGAVTGQTPAPVAADYLPLRPSALLLFQCGDGTVARVVVPSPKAGLFLADGETVDPADPLGVLAALLAVITSSSGSAATAFVAGTLQPK